MLERVMIISGESSGELYGSLLARELRSRNSGISIIGVGGDRMEAAGVRLIARISSSFGVTEAIRTFGALRKTFRQVCADLESFRPQVLVLIDYPDFNVRVAKEAKKKGIKVLYYVSPQVWAWRSGRVRVIGRIVDRMAVILPFEEDIYKRAGVPCRFVGHPAFDEIREVLNNYAFGGSEVTGLKQAVRVELGLIPDKPVIALMPGSRPHEINRLMPVMADVISRIKKLYPDYQFVIPVAPNLDGKALTKIHNVPGEAADNRPVITHDSVKALLAADAAVIASGTSTLQAALLNVPMVVIYKLSPLTFFLGKLIVKVKYISLVNILLDHMDGSEHRVRELLQDDASSDNVLMELTRIMQDAEYRAAMISQLGKVGALFSGRRAAAETAEMAEELGTG